MGFFDHYPYTNFHNVNLDWVLQAVKAWGHTVEVNDQAFQDLEAANASFKAFVTGYLANLDVSDEINDKLDQMLEDGVLAPYMAPYIQTDVSAWLEQHITPTTPAVDNSLSVSGAAADAKITGDAFDAVKKDLSEAENFLVSIDSGINVGTLTTGTYVIPSTGSQGALAYGCISGYIDNYVSGTSALSDRRVPLMFVAGFDKSVYKYTIYGYAAHSVSSASESFTDGKWTTQENVLILPKNAETSCFKFSAIRIDGQGTITEEQAEEILSNIKIMRITDATLTRPGIAADAKKTGEEIGALKEGLNVISPIAPVGLYGNDILPSIGTFANRTNNGITYTWNEGHTECTVSGTAQGLSFSNIYNNMSSLPEGVSAGDLLKIEFNTTDVNLTLQVVFYNANAEQIISTRLTGDTELSVPTNAAGAIIRLRVGDGITVNATVSDIGLYVSNDVSADILSRLTNYGVCYLREGIYPVKRLNMPDGSTIEGFGAKSVIRLINSDFEDRYAIKMGQKCAIKDVTISGPDSHYARTTASATVGGDVGVLWSGASGVYPTNGIISDVRFLNIKGSGIKCTATTMATYRKCAITGCNFENCDAGINIDDVSEFHHISDCSFYGCYYGVINNGGNNRFTGCVFGVNAVHMKIDGSHENSAHSGATNCVFAHAFGFDENGNIVSNAGVALQINDVEFGYLFTGCQFGFGSIDLTGSEGLMFTGCMWSGASNRNVITINGGSGTFFNSCEFANTPTINISDNEATHLINCFLKNGTTVTT